MTTAQLIVEELRDFCESERLQVLESVRSMKRRDGAARGSAAAAMQAFGAWRDTMTAQEIEQWRKDLDEQRQLDLEHADNDLSPRL